MEKGFIKVKVDKLKKAEWNYKTDNDELLGKLKANIKKNGQIENLIVRELGDGSFEVVNGNHRLQVLKELNIPEAMVYNLGNIPVRQAKKIAVETNETKFESDTAKLAKLIADVASDFDLSDLVDTMPYNEIQLKSLIDMGNFNTYELLSGVRHNNEDDDSVEINEADYFNLNFGDTEGSSTQGTTAEPHQIIQYNIIFSNEEEKDYWYKYIAFLKNKYPDAKTISERIVLDIKQRIENAEI